MKKNVLKQWVAGIALAALLAALLAGAGVGVANQVADYQPPMPFTAPIQVADYQPPMPLAIKA